MKYSEDEFLSLLVQIEEQGGRLLDDKHETKLVQLEMLREYEATGKLMKVRLRGCGEQAMFEVPYEGTDSRGTSIVACAVCDNIGAWPRFSQVAPNGS
jgi:hypothetical protein